MALRLNTEFSGIPINNSYGRIDDFNGNKQGMDFTFIYFVNKQASDDGELPFKKETHHFIPNVNDAASNYHKQGYEHLKTLPEFQTAIDVLE